MNLTEEYNRARDHILKVNFKKNVYVGVFETTIRVLGGFLGAYTVTNDERFIQKAKEMAELLLPGKDFHINFQHLKLHLVCLILKSI